MRRLSFHLIVTALVPFLSVVGVRAAAAQIVPRKRLRVRVDSPPPSRVLVGTVRSMNADTLVLALDPDSAVERIPVATISRLEVSRGRHVVFWHVWIGAGIGSMLGVAVASSSSSCSNHEIGCVGAGTVGIGLGLALGALVGLAATSEKWEPVVVLPRVAVAPLSRRGVGVGLRVGF